MSVVNSRTDLPVLILHNVDPAWAPPDIEDALEGVAELESTLRQIGHPVTNVPVNDANLYIRLRDFDPNKHIVFNWCEALPGIPNSEALVAHTLTELNFTYTGSTSAALALGWDKPNVKRLLDQWGIPTPS